MRLSTPLGTRGRAVWGEEQWKVEGGKWEVERDGQFKEIRKISPKFLVLGDKKKLGT